MILYQSPCPHVGKSRETFVCILHVNARWLPMSPKGVKNDFWLPPKKVILCWVTLYNAQWTCPLSKLLIGNLSTLQGRAIPHLKAFCMGKLWLNGLWGAKRVTRYISQNVSFLAKKWGFSDITQNLSTLQLSAIPLLKAFFIANLQVIGLWGAISHSGAMGPRIHSSNSKNYFLSQFHQKWCNFA